MLSGAVYGARTGERRWMGVTGQVGWFERVNVAGMALRSTLINPVAGFMTMIKRKGLKAEAYSPNLKKVLIEALLL